MPLYPFEQQTDAAGHNVTGITFDRPIPWPEFDGGTGVHGSSGGDGSIADRIALALDPVEAERERERAEKYLGAIEGAVSALDPLTDADGHFSLAVRAAQEGHDLVLSLQARFTLASQIISNSKPGAVAMREARAAALDLLFADETVSTTISLLQHFIGARDHAQRGANVVSTQVRNLQEAQS